MRTLYNKKCIGILLITHRAEALTFLWVAPTACNNEKKLPKIMELCFLLVKTFSFLFGCKRQSF